MSRKYSKQLVISTTMLESFEMDVAKGLVKNADQKGIPCDFVDIGFLRPRAHEEQLQFIDPGISVYLKKDNKVIYAEKDIRGEKTEKREYKNTEEMYQDLEKRRIEKVNSLDSDARIHIIGHGEKGVDLIKGFSKDYTSEQLAQIIATNEKFKNISDKSVTISLAMCQGAMANGKKDSFALKFSKALAKRGIYAKVSARYGDVRVPTDSKEKAVYKLVQNQHHGVGSKIYFETDPVTQNTLIRPVIYKDNVASLVVALKEIDYLYKTAKGNENALAKNPNDTRLRETLNNLKSKLAQVAYDLAVDRNYHSSLGKDFHELNKMRWGGESDLKVNQIYSTAVDTLTKELKNCVAKDPSLVKSKVETIEKIEKLNLFRPIKLYQKYNEFTAPTKNEINLMSKNCPNWDWAKMQYHITKTLVKDKSYDSYLLESYKALIAESCLKHGITNPEINKFKYLFESKEMTSKSGLGLKTPNDTTNIDINIKFKAQN